MLVCKRLTTWWFSLQLLELTEQQKLLLQVTAWNQDTKQFNIHIKPAAVAIYSNYYVIVCNNMIVERTRSEELLELIVRTICGDILAFILFQDLIKIYRYCRGFIDSVSTESYFMRKNNCRLVFCSSRPFPPPLFLPDKRVFFSPDI